MEEPVIQLPATALVSSLLEAPVGSIVIDDAGNVAMRARWRDRDDEDRYAVLVPFTGTDAWRIRWFEVHGRRLPNVLGVPFTDLRVTTHSRGSSSVESEVIGQLRIDSEGMTVSIALMSDECRGEFEMLYLRLSDGTFSGRPNGRCVNADSWTLNLLDGRHEAMSLQISSGPVFNE